MRISKLLVAAVLGCGSQDTAHHSVGVDEGEQAQQGLALGERVSGRASSSRQEAIEQARSAGVLGSGRHGGGMASLTASADYSSGFDDGNVAGRFRDHGRNPWTETAKDKVSTFAADVDTASYTIARRELVEGRLPHAAMIRVEEWVNYFRYEMPAPAATFGVVMDAAPSPLTPGKHVVRVGVSTRAKATSERAPAHLVFLVDVSGSMSGTDRLGLAKQALKILVDNLHERDTVALVTYAGETRLALPATSARERWKIRAAISALDAGGSTAMASGIDLAYREAAKGLAAKGNARVIVLSDGDANVGAATHEEILKQIAGRAKEGVTLSTIGFGVGNYHDELMEQLANKGNGNNYFIDDLAAARRVFGEASAATLEVAAADVKLQVEFDPAMVARYRLVGYENRDLADQDFRDDKVDAGEIGPGHQVTAIYEVELTAAGKQANAPLGGVRIRHKEPKHERATEAAYPMVGGPAAAFAEASADLRFAFAVAAFADKLRGGDDSKRWSLAQIQQLAAGAAGTHIDRQAFVKLVERAASLPRS